MASIIYSLLSDMGGTNTQADVTLQALSLQLFDVSCGTTKQDKVPQPSCSSDKRDRLSLADCCSLNAVMTSSLSG